METKERFRVGRAEAAARLRQLADSIESGSMQAGGMSIELPEELMYELQIEEKAGGGEVEIDIEWKR